MKKILFLYFTFISLLFSESFQLKTMDGQFISINTIYDGLEFVDFKNKKVVLEFFGTHCGPCQAMTGTMDAINSKNDTQVIAIEVQDSSPQEIKEFISTYMVNYPVIDGNAPSNKRFLYFLNQNGKLPGYIPFSLKFDKNGKLLN